MDDNTQDIPNLAPTATTRLKKLEEEKSQLMKKRENLRTELEQLLDSIAAPAPGPSVVSARPHAYKKVEKRKRRRTTSSFSSTTTISSSSSSSSSSDEKKKRKKKKSKKTSARSFERMTTPEQVTHRYKLVLKTYKKNLSIRDCLKRHKVDKSTLALTSIIAEVAIASEGELYQVPAYVNGTTLQCYSKELQQFLVSCPSLETKILTMKKEHKLLPIKNKFRR